MSRYIFLFKDNSCDDYRDCVYYIKLEDIGKYNGTIGVSGPCFWQHITVNDIDFDNITTILTKEEFELLANADGKDLSAIAAKLQSEDNAALFEQVCKEEAEYLYDEYDLDERDLKDIFDAVSFDGYKDRGVVANIYDDAEELGREEMWGLGYMNDYNEHVLEQFFDFEGYGNDILRWHDAYVQLRDGRIVSLNYQL